jgi:hypothetical protein
MASKETTSTRRGQHRVHPVPEEPAVGTAEALLTDHHLDRHRARACAIPNEMAAAKAPLTRLNNSPSNAAEGKPLAKSSMKDGNNARIACKAISVAEINGVHAP